jgi:hypothetical protein
MLNMKKQAAASNGKAAVLVGATANGDLLVIRYAPRAAGHWDRRDEFAALATRAARKLGYTRDRRCRTGYRYLGVENQR